MGEVIDWRSLQPVQRDKVVHEKVMGFSAVCNGELTVTLHKIPSRAGGIAFEYAMWRCTLCAAGGSCATDNIPKEHAAMMEIPRYTQSLDAAWLVVKRFSVGVELYYLPGNATTCRISGTISGPTFGVAQHPADAICIAALEAKGYEVIRY